MKSRKQPIARGEERAAGGGSRRESIGPWCGGEKGERCRDESVPQGSQSYILQTTLGLLVGENPQR